MKHKISLILTSLLLTFLLSNTSFSASQESITINDPYVRAIPPGQTISAVFMTINNSSDKELSLVNATSNISKIVELHSHVHENGMMKMRRVESIKIPAKGQAVLKPGGFHIMLIDLHDNLKIDQKVSITLTFSDNSSMDITAVVRKIMMPGMMKMKMKH